MISTRDRTILRELARQVAEIAALPIQAARRDLWRRHNALDPTVRPLILVFPEGSWRELLPGDALQCGDGARDHERALRTKLYTERHFDTDYPIEATHSVGRYIGDTGWGLETTRVNSDAATGAFGFAPTMRSLADAEKLKHPELTIDEAAAARDLALAQDVFGDLLEVRQKGRTHMSCHLSAMFTGWRGMDQFCLDMIDEPRWVHETMNFVTEGVIKLRDRQLELGLIDLNNEDDYHSSGGVGYSDELPAPGYEPGNLRFCDVWGSAESQEMTMISPDMHAEFIMQYEARFIQPFGLNGYGCCDDLTLKLDAVCALPQMRRISISPFADPVRCAEQLQGGYILSWKPHPSHLVGEFREEMIRAYIRKTLEAAAANGCVLEMILKDTHTCDGRPERFTAWTRIAREEVARICETTGRWQNEATA